MAYSHCTNAATTDTYAVGMFDSDVTEERTPDVGDVHPALRVCPAKRPLSDESNG
jgi:hypothetical protein